MISYQTLSLISAPVSPPWIELWLLSLMVDSCLPRSPFMDTRGTQTSTETPPEKTGLTPPRPLFFLFWSFCPPKEKQKQRHIPLGIYKRGAFPALTAGLFQSWCFCFCGFGSETIQSAKRILAISLAIDLRSSVPGGVSVEV